MAIKCGYCKKRQANSWAVFSAPKKQAQIALCKGCGAVLKDLLDTNNKPAIATFINFSNKMTPVPDPNTKE